jgi:2-methylaconitate cis-trans-isomerase PrpF
MIGLVQDETKARMESPAIPLLSIVSPPADYVSFTHQRQIRSDEVDFVARVFYMQEMHKSYSVTATVCTGTAAMIPGTVVHQATSARAHETSIVRLGHPSGVIPIEVQVDCRPDGVKLNKAALGRTSRRIMDGFVYVPESLF